MISGLRKTFDNLLPQNKKGIGEARSTIFGYYRDAMETLLDIPAIKEKCVPELKKAGVLRSALFGSFARGEAGPESDVDILIEFPEDKTLFDLIELEGKLKSALGRKVDVITYRSLHHLLRDRILQEQIQIL